MPIRFLYYARLIPCDRRKCILNHVPAGNCISSSAGESFRSIRIKTRHYAEDSSGRNGYCNNRDSKPCTRTRIALDTPAEDQIRRRNREEG
jgi:hypothetical protein